MNQHDSFYEDYEKQGKLARFIDYNIQEAKSLGPVDVATLTVCGLAFVETVLGVYRKEPFQAAAGAGKFILGVAFGNAFTNRRPNN